MLQLLRNTTFLTIPIVVLCFVAFGRTGHHWTESIQRNARETRGFEHYPNMKIGTTEEIKAISAQVVYVYKRSKLMMAAALNEVSASAPASASASSSALIKNSPVDKVFEFSPPVSPSDAAVAAAEDICDE